VGAYRQACFGADQICFGADPGFTKSARRVDNFYSTMLRRSMPWPRRWNFWSSNTQVLINYNDSPRRTKQDVIALIDGAIRRVEDWESLRLLQATNSGHHAS
jgi:hypothetical protein